MSTNTLQKNESTSLAVPAAFQGQFNDSEVLGGMDVSTSYLQQYPYLLRIQPSRFEILDQKSGEIVATRDKIEKAIVFYAHAVYRLHQGTVRGNKNPMETWTDDEKTMVAQSYASPFSRSKPSRGNFDANGYGEWLDNKQLRRDVVKRLYMFMLIPGVSGKGEIVAATFGSTAGIALETVRKQLLDASLPLPSVYMEMGVEMVTNDQGKSYPRPTFKVLRDQGGFAMMTTETSEEYRAKLRPLQQKIEETHDFAIQQVEGSPAAVSTDAITDHDTSEALPMGVTETVHDGDIPF